MHGAPRRPRPSLGAAAELARPQTSKRAKELKNIKELQEKGEEVKEEPVYEIQMRRRTFVDKAVAEWKTDHPAPVPDAMEMRLRGTLIVVPPTLLGQWKEEFTKFAPGLKVYISHSGFAKDYRQIRQGNNLLDADVVIVSTHSSSNAGFSAKHAFGCSSLKWHRVILDEAHMLKHRGALNGAKLRWAVTGTPMSKSIDDLSAVADWLGHWHKPYKKFKPPAAAAAAAAAPADDERTGLQLCNLFASYGGWRRRAASSMELTDAQLETAVAALQTLMIRHTKSMQIEGEAALALPTLECEDVRLEMSADEAEVYKGIISSLNNNWKICRGRLRGMDGVALAMVLGPIYSVLGGSYDELLLIDHSRDLETLDDHLTTPLTGIKAWRETGKPDYYAIGMPVKKQFMGKVVTKADYQTLCRAFESRTKLKKLEADIAALQEAEKNFHAVVFTQSAAVHDQVVQVGLARCPVRARAPTPPPARASSPSGWRLRPTPSRRASR